MPWVHWDKEQCLRCIGIRYKGQCFGCFGIRDNALDALGKGTMPWMPWEKGQCLRYLGKRDNALDALGKRTMACNASG
eukprot:scaffold24904_cov18-Tisochrysis_lutea.AAC.1